MDDYLEAKTILDESKSIDKNNKEISFWVFIVKNVLSLFIFNSIFFI